MLWGHQLQLEGWPAAKYPALTGGGIFYGKKHKTLCLGNIIMYRKGGEHYEYVDES